MAKVVASGTPPPRTRAATDAHAGAMLAAARAALALGSREAPLALSWRKGRELARDPKDMYSYDGSEHLCERRARGHLSKEQEAALKAYLDAKSKAAKAAKA